MTDKFKSSGGFDGANKKITNIADADQPQDAVNLAVLDQKNTLPSFSVSRAYPLGFIVEFSGQVWKNSTAVTAPGPFNPANWTALAGKEHWLRITGNYTAGVMESLFVDGSTAISITLPITPKSGDYVNIFDSGSARSKPITVIRNGSTINGAAADLVLDKDNIRASLIFLGGTWKVVTTEVSRVEFLASSSASLISGIEYIIDATSSFTLTLPSAPKVGDKIKLVDRSGTLGVNTITINGSGKQIDGSATKSLNQVKARLNLAYNGVQWVTWADAGNSLLASNNLSELENKADARTALELGSAAQASMGAGPSQIKTNTENESSFQPKDQTLTELASLSVLKDQVIYGTGPDTFGVSALTEEARALLGKATKSQQRESLGLGTAATTNVGEDLGDTLGVGSFGIGSSGVITTNADSITKSGFYLASETTTGSPTTDRKSTVVHIEPEVASGVASQQAVDSIGVLYVRTRVSGVWTAWATISTTGSLGTAAYKNTGLDVGEVLEVGSYGIGASDNVSPSCDIKRSGLYGILSAADAPRSGIGQLLVIVYSPDWVSQIYTCMGSYDEIYIRHYHNGTTWTPWQELFSTANILRGVGDSDKYPMTQKAVTEAIRASGDSKAIYQGSYGLTWDSLTDTYIRTGAAGYASIQSMMKRCVLNEDGSVNYYLHPTNSNFKEDGSPSNLTGADGNVMVQIPKFYVKYTMDGTLRKQEVSLTADVGFVVHPAFIKGGVAVPFRYAPAYRGILMGGKLRSVSGVNPTTNRSISQFRADSIANGVGWHLNDWHLYNAIRTLCTIEIGTLNTQDVLGAGNSTGSNYTRATGVSNAIGNGSSNTSIAGWMSYRGIEDYYASSWQFMDGINIQNYQVFVNGDYRTFASDVFTGDYVSTGVTVPAGASASYIKDMNFSINGMIPTMIGGASTTYTGDGLWSATGNRIAFVGGSAEYSWACGGFTLFVASDSAHVLASMGAGVSF